MRVYRIVETCFEYNDEYSYPGEGTRPVKGYRSEAAARTECKRLNEEAFVRNNPFEYSDGCPLSDDDLPRIRDLIAADPGDIDSESIDDVSDINDLWDSLSAEQSIEIWKLTQDYSDEYFYSVCEMEIEDCQVRSAGAG